MTVRILERTTYRSPLALRFLDAVSRRPVTRGLVVRAWPVGDRSQSRTATVSPASGLHGFTNLPGLAGYQDGRRPATDWCPNANAPGNFVVQAEDAQGCFLPAALLLCIPREAVVEVPLFSSPSRPSPAGLAVLRGQITDAANGNAPAAWAAVEVASADGDTTLTLCDQRGMFLALLPTAGPVTVGVHYQPAAQVPVDGGPPDVRSLLAQAPAAPAAIQRELRFGHPVVITTAVQPA